MSKLGDDLIRSLKEALDHAQSKGRCTEHSPAGARGPAPDDAKADFAADESDPVGPSEP